MNTTQTNSTMLWLVIAIVGSTPGALAAANSFSDDFTNSGPTNPGRNPVTWRLVLAETISIENGDLTLERASGLSSAGIEGFTAQNVSIETRFRILQGSNAGIGVRTIGTNVSDCYFGDVSASGAGLYRCGGAPLGNSAPVTFDPTQEDAVMRLRAVGNKLSLWVWPADEIMPVEPLATANHSALTGGGVGLFVSSSTQGNPTKAVFRYFNVEVVPEPSTSMLAILGAIAPMIMIRNRCACSTSR